MTGPHGRARRHCIIVNPAAGGGAAGHNWPALERRLRAAGLEFTPFVTEGRGHATELARAALEAGLRSLLVVGGDGAASEVLDGMFRAPAHCREAASLAVVPWGTGNDWAGYHGFSRDPDAVIELLRHGSTGTQDVGRVVAHADDGAAVTHYFLNCAGTGFDSYLLRRMGSAHGQRLRYLWSILRCLGRYRAAELELDTSAGPLRASALMLEVCLGRSFGGGMRLFPDADASDGQFDVLLIDDMSPLRLLGSLPYLYNGRITSHPSVRSWRTDRLSVRGTRGEFLHCDGELVGRLPARIELLPNALTVLLPHAKQRRHGAHIQGSSASPSAGQGP